MDIGAGSDTSGTNHLVSHCTIQNTGLKGVYMRAATDFPLTKSNLRVEDCEISNFGRVGFCYQPAVQIYGCGQIVRNNLFRDSHHSAILWDGNDHLMELNEIHRVCQTSGDVGAIYSSNDWGARGNIIRHNYIHDVYSVLGRWVHGIYLDDCLSGVTVQVTSSRTWWATPSWRAVVAITS
ncbi:MAG: right-handed parallel beta-helix repeat-containing protein [Verrucomicrobia bacterium]|nr:right-handed parallel beta-helix repeat-containing protein [Verrucomicrobiota bacterium]